MIFQKELLKDKVDEGVFQEIIERSRWSILYREIFQHDGKFYETYYSTAATECQDELPYEFDDDDIWCDEVELIEKVTKVWQKVETSDKSEVN